MNVLSLFDGMSCGQIALDRIGVKYDNYFASEIDKHSIKVTQSNYSKTIQIGDIRNIKAVDLPKIDLLIGGSPCQGFSFAGKQLNFEDERSKLFFEFIRLLKELNPTYFLLENVRMKEEYQNVISSLLNVKPIVINSALMSAQNRVRYYWTNIKGVTQPTDKKIKLSDILQSDNFKTSNKATILGRRINSRGVREDYNKSIPLVQCLEVRASNREKSNCLTTVAKDTVLTPLPIGRHIDVYGKKLLYRNYTAIERLRLQNIDDDYCNGLSLNQVVKMTGNSFTVDVIAHILSFINGT